METRKQFFFPYSRAILCRKLSQILAEIDSSLRSKKLHCFIAIQKEMLLHGRVQQRLFSSLIFTSSGRKTIRSWERFTSALTLRSLTYARAQSSHTQIKPLVLLSLASSSPRLSSLVYLGQINLIVNVVRVHNWIGRIINFISHLIAQGMGQARGHFGISPSAVK